MKQLKRRAKQRLRVLGALPRLDMRTATIHKMVTSPVYQSGRYYRWTRMVGRSRRPSRRGHWARRGQ